MDGVAPPSFLASRTHAAPDGIGKPVRRKEDPRLLTGAGRFGDDVNLPGQAHAAFVRSPHPHARIGAIDAAAALGVLGVLAVLTGADAAADGLRPIPHRPVPTNPHEVPLRSRDGSEFFVAPHLPLPADRARFVGEPVAMVVAETAAAARDGADRVRVDWAPLAAVTTAAAAVAADAPALYPECPGNVCVDSRVGDRAATDAAFARAAHVVTLTTRINRVTGVPMEPRTALASYDEATGRYTLHAGSGGVQRCRADLAGTLGVAEDAVRVIAGDVGGNYGTRNSSYPEFSLVAWAARRLRRPVKWTCDRTEALLTDYQSRDLHAEVSLALDRDGAFLALRGANTSNVGAHAVSFIPLAKGIGVLPSVYRISTALMDGRAVLTNTAPTTPYRSAGRPEVMFVIERLIDLAARRHGFDRVTLRRRNLIPREAMPHTNPLGLVYDSGDYGAAQDRVVALADWAGFEARRAEARRRGRQRGIGLANYIELNTGAPRERAEITARPDGAVEVVLGTLSAGQGHETSFAQLVAEWLGVSLPRVHLVTGDTERAPVGGGSHSGRSMRLGAVVMARAADALVARGAVLAAWLLEAAPADIVFAAGRFAVRGTSRTVELAAIATAALRTDAPPALRGPLAGASDETMPVPSFPYGSAVCEVEVDAETGVVEIVRYTTVDDVGRAVNPLILHGQTHGGIAAGVGQALWELCDYDEAGQQRAATFMEYALPRADQLPPLATEISEVPSTSNPLGLRGGGEGGTTPALAAVVNAIVDALAELGVEHLEMPATPERVWRAIQAARR
ncbi:MAG TPA: xanthine dehydrogenase family protein molybdopterin-binding subunit [Methylomirabilota bacterium]|nr:xanthine dehydrogenase family protein molybdopterin-binding subunit [Methylomirabilota bacterium]